MTVAGHCPHLGLAGNRNQKFVVASSRHRCYVWHQPERIGNDYQAVSCLTSAYRRCARFMTEAESNDQPARDGDPSHPLEAPRRSTGHVTMEDARPAEQAPGAKAVDRYTDLKRAPTRRTRKPRRSLSLTEGAVLCLGIALLLACSFIGYAAAYRWQVGPGMAAAPLLAEGAGFVSAELLPSSVVEGPTLVPTFTPTPTPIPPTVEPVTEPPTPLPEPPVPTPEPVARPPAGAPPTRLVIERIGLDIPVVPVGTKALGEGSKSKRVWADVPNAGGFHQTSAYPGQPGNTVINGHRDIQGSVFRHLDRVQRGDEIVVYVGEVAYPYQVTEILVVPEAFASAAQRAENLRLIGYMPEERLTLVTCTPVGLASHRLLVIAKPPDQPAARMPEAGTSTQP